MSTTTATRSAISILGLTKSYGDLTVLQDIDLTINEGEIFALLGPNGAGKTTMVEILSTLIPADRGRVTVAGHDLGTAADGVRASIGVTGQFSALDDLLTTTENLLLMADLHHLRRPEGRHRVAELIELFDLGEVATKAASSLSGGMRRRLDLAMTLVGRPAVIFLDEPTAGLDPRSRRDMWRTVETLARQGVTIFLTTQYLEEADRLADRIAVLDRGRLVAEGTPAELKRQIPGGHVTLQFADHDRLVAAADVLEWTARDDTALTLQVSSDGGVPALRGLLDRLDRVAIEVTELAVHTPDLDDVFLALTARGDGSRADGTDINCDKSDPR